MTRTYPGLRHQVDLWTDQTQDAKVAVVGPLGCGKTMGLAIKARLLAEANAGANGLLVVPTVDNFRMVHQVEWPTIIANLHDGVRLVFSPSLKAFMWIVSGGKSWGKLWVRSAEAPERLAGPNLGYVLFDEPGQMPREAWERGSVRARHPHAPVRQTVLAGTPEGNTGWFAENFSNPEPPFRTIWAQHWHPDFSQYQDQIRATYGYDDSLMATYGRGQFVPLRVGRAYRFFNRAVHVPEGGVPYEPLLPLVLGCDFNVDAMRWVIMQFHEQEIRALGEITLGRDGSTEEAARVFVERWGAKVRATEERTVTVCPDATGAARSTSGRTDLQVIRETLEAAQLRVRFDMPKANPRQKDRIDNANYHLSGRGRRVLIDPACKQLVLDLESVTWREGGVEIDKTDPMRTHASDAWSYPIWTLARALGMGGPTFSAGAPSADIRTKIFTQKDHILGMRF